MFSVRIGRNLTSVVAFIGLAAILWLTLPGAVANAKRGHGPKKADTVMRNGFIYTVDKRNSRRQAIAVRNGKIAYVGSNRGVRKYIGKRTKVKNLRGHMVMPGLQDGHIHELIGGANLLKCDLNFQPLTTEQFQQSIQSCLDETSGKEPDTWLQVVGWYRQAMLPSGTDATKADLDSLNTERPIFVTSSDHHSKLVNSRALEVAGITDETPNPPDGEIIRDDEGHATGILEDGAGWAVQAKIPPPTAEDNVEAAAEALKAMAAQGITSFMSQGSSAEEIKAFRSLRNRGELTARPNFAPGIDETDLSNPKKTISPVLKLRRKFDDGRQVPRPGLTVRNSGEVGLDGVLQAPAHTASLLEPYFVNAGTEEDPNWVPGTDRGPLYLKQAELGPIYAAMAKAGIDPQSHAIGDRAVRTSLNAYRYARKHVGKAKMRKFRGQISHAELVHPDDYGRFRKLNVTPVMSFQWAKPAPDSIDAARDFMGPERFARMEPEGSLKKAGARIAYGSDWPVDELNEWFALQVGITRKNRADSGPYAGYRLGDEAGLSRKYALRAITMNSAYALHHDHKTGSIERGKFADLIELDRNVLKVPVMTIADTKVLSTMVGGKTVYRSGR